MNWITRWIAPSQSGAGSAEPSARKGFWSFVSDDESVERGQINFWAITETALAIGVFWYVALTRETFFLLYTSLIVAPLLFLRSSKSVAQGVEWLDDGFFPLMDEDLATPIIVLICWGIGLAFMFVTIFLEADIWSANFIILTCLMFTVPLQAVVMVWGGLRAAIRGGGVTLAGMATREVQQHYKGAVDKAVAVSAQVMFELMVLPTFALGVLIASLIFRCCATFRYPIDGYAAMPKNIRQLAFFTAPGHLPELLPGLPKPHELQFDTVIASGKEFLASSEISNKLIGVLFLLLAPILFLPGWAYRFILKSTLWLWWFLFVIGGAPNVKDGIEGLRADVYRKSFSWILIALAVFGIVGFGFGTALKPIVANHLSAAPLLSTVALLVLIDWRGISLFQWLSLLSSALTLVVAVWAHSLWVDYRDVPARKETVEKRLPWLGHLVKWKTAVGMTSIALLMVYIALYANTVEHWVPVSDWAFRWLQLLYRENAEALLPQS